LKLIGELDSFWLIQKSLAKSPLINGDIHMVPSPAINILDNNSNIYVMFSIKNGSALAGSSCSYVSLSSFVYE